MRDSVVLKRYLEALVQSVQKSDVESVLIALIKLIHTVENEQGLWDVLQSPAIDKAKKEAVLCDILPMFSTNKVFRNFIIFMVKKDRILLLKSMRFLVKEALLKVKNQLEVVVDTTDGFGAKEQKMLSKYLKDMTQKDIFLSINIDEKMLGGFKAKVNNVLYDGTVENALDKLKLSFN